MASVKRPGRKPLNTAFVRSVRDLIGFGLSDRAVVAKLAEGGIIVKRTTVQRIRHDRHCEKQPSTSRLAAGETSIGAARCNVCGCKNKVSPCRTCAAKDYFERLRTLANEWFE